MFVVLVIEIYIEIIYIETVDCLLHMLGAGFAEVPFLKTLP